MIEVRNPVNQFLDSDGSPLDAGYIYVGTTGANPELSPLTVYWDKAGTIPAVQPIRTLNGYPARDGAASKFYTSVKNYSMTAKDKRGQLVFSTLNADSGIFDELANDSGAASVGYENATSGLSATDVQAAIDELNTDIETVASSQSQVVNLFDNPAFLINQRAYVSGTPTVAANQYTIDRIRVVVLGQSLAFSASATFGNMITAPAGGAESIIEANRVTGGEYACNWGGFGTVTVNGIARAKEEAFNLPANTDVTIRFVGDIEKFRLTRPSMVDVFEYDYISDLKRCMYYYEAATIYIANVANRMTVWWRERKRITPTIALTISSGTGGVMAGSGANGAYQSVANSVDSTAVITASAEMP